MPRITRSTCSAIASSLPSPFCTDATHPSANACAVAAIAAAVCIAFVATMPKSHGGIPAASLVAAWTPDDVAGAGEPQAVAVDRVDVHSLRSNAQTSTSSSSARFAANSDPTAPQPTTQTLTE